MSGLWLLDIGVGKSLKNSSSVFGITLLNSVLSSSGIYEVSNEDLQAVFIIFKTILWKP